MEILREQSALRGGAPALIEGRGDRRRALSFAELDRATATAAATLRAHGLRPGDAVLLLHPVSITLYVALLGVFRAGLAAVFLDPSAGREHVARCAAMMPIRGLLGSRRALLLSLFAPPLRRIPVRLHAGSRRGAAENPSPVPRGADDPALITFTSGSTGQPKAVVRSHGFLVSQHRALASSIALEAGEVDLVTLPVFLLANLASGLTSVLPEVDLRAPGEVDAAVLVDQIRGEHVSRTAASPALLERLVAHCEQIGITLPDLRKIYTGGAPVFPRTLDALRRIAPGAAVVAVYGSTEAEPIAHVESGRISAADQEAMRNGGGLLAGIPEPCVRLRVIAHHDGPIGQMSQTAFDAVTQPPESAGEIVVAGDHVLKGYWQGRGDSETKFRVENEVWHRTGDAGRLDRSGRLWLLGRAAARIARGAEILYPFAVEAAVSSVETVRRSALAQVDGRVVLAVEPRDGQGGGELKRQITGQLAWARIDEIRLVAKVPVDRRHNAKVDYPALMRQLADPGDHA